MNYIFRNTVQTQFFVLIGHQKLSPPEKILVTALFLVLLPIVWYVSCVKFDALKAANIENNQNHHSYY
jgi:hypothetical protein